MSMNQRNGNGKGESMGDLAAKALISANTKLVLERRKTGDALVVWRDGKVCRIPASEIELPQDIPLKD